MPEHPTVEFDNAAEVAESVRTSRQARHYAPDPVPSDIVDSHGDAMFALEVPAGWYAAHDVEEGDVVRIVFDPPGGSAGR